MSRPADQAPALARLAHLELGQLSFHPVANTRPLPPPGGTSSPPVPVMAAPPVHTALTPPASTPYFGTLTWMFEEIGRWKSAEGYKANYRVGDHQVGQWSAEVSAIGGG